MACGMIAMLNAGIEVESYDAYEIDKYAIQVSSHNFPNIRHHGDVFQADFTQHEGVDFLVGGSPCTYWSIAQKNNRETEASGMGWELFSQYVRAVREAKPKFFIYENNKSMSAAIRESIDRAFGFESICINSALVSAQNRQRLYWVGMRNEDGTYSKVPVGQPEDRGVLLRDIIESNVVGSTRIPEYGSEEKARPVTACYAYKGSGEGSLLTEAFQDNKNKQVRDYVAEPVNTTDTGKSIALKAQYYKDNVSNFVVHQTAYGYKSTGVAESVRVGAMPRPNGELSTSQAFRVYHTDGKSVNITAGGGGAGGKTGLYAIEVPMYAQPIEWDDDGKPTKAVSGADGKTYQVYEVKDGQITIKGEQYPVKLADGYYIIRKLTVTECMRLQTVPEWYDFSVISNSQAYKCLGNGWTCDVITHLINATQKAARRKWLDDLLGDCL